MPELIDARRTAGSASILRSAALRGAEAEEFVFAPGYSKEVSWGPAEGGLPEHHPLNTQVGIIIFQFLSNKTQFETIETDIKSLGIHNLVKTLTFCKTNATTY